MPEAKKRCFVAMPSGRGPAAEAYYSGWYAEVIEPAIVKAGFDPFLCAAVDAPNSITDDILLHITDDPMMVADVGGMTADDPPNPNVMYELGIRHAFGKPVVVMGWKDQFIPFDVKDQRFLLDSRNLNAFARNRERLETFLREAERGNYFKPIEAVSRRAELKAAIDATGNDALRGLAEQVALIGERVQLLLARQQAEFVWGLSRAEEEATMRTLGRVAGIKGGSGEGGK